MKTQIFTIAFLSFLGACQSSHNESPTNSNNSLSSQSSQASQASSEYSVKHLGSKVILADDRSNLDEYIENINIHKLRVTAVAGLNSYGSIKCRKLVAGELDNTYSSRFNQNGQSTELFVPLFPADPIATEFSCQVNDSTGKELKEIKFTIPKNFVVRHKTTLPELHNQKIGTLLLTEDAEIITEGRPLKLDVRNLISLNGTVSTFESLAVDLTPADTHGRDGGIITLNVAQAQGNLTINLRGTNAGKQTFVPKRPRKASAGSRGSCYDRSNPRSCDGQNGSPGLPAVDGKDGFNGGHSGSIDIILAKKSDFEVVINYAPGIGSKGVKASLPGEGGDGGEAGSIHTRIPGCTGGSYCLSIISGKPGAPGPQGSFGLDGNDGFPGEIETSKFINMEDGQNEYIKQSWSNIKGYL